MRYGLALIIVLTLPPALPFGVFIHSFVRFCRALGPAWTYGLVGGLIALAMVGLAIEFGTNLPLLASGMNCLATARWLRLRLYRHMGPSVLMGLPELAPERYPTRLVTEGLYGRMRHLRYIQGSLALHGYMLIANYPALLVVLAL